MENFVVRNFRRMKVRRTDILPYGNFAVKKFAIKKKISCKDISPYGKVVVCVFSIQLIRGFY